MERELYERGKRREKEKMGNMQRVASGVLTEISATLNSLYESGASKQQSKEYLLRAIDSIRNEDVKKQVIATWAFEKMKVDRSSLVKTQEDAKRWVRALEIVKIEKGWNSESDITNNNAWGLVVHIFQGMNKVPDVEIPKEYQDLPYSANKVIEDPQFSETKVSIKDAHWIDVRNKAKRLRNTGKVQLYILSKTLINGHVIGDHGEYGVYLYRQSSSSLKISFWGCDCPWGQWAWKRQHTYIGRFCSHAYALLMEAQSRAMRDQGGGLWQDNPDFEYQARMADEDTDNKEDTLNQLGILDYNEYLHRLFKNKKPQPKSVPDVSIEDIDLLDLDDVENPEPALVPGDRDPYYSPMTVTNKIAGKDFTIAEQNDLVNEVGVARNLYKLRLEGTHYVQGDVDDEIELLFL